MKEEENRSIFCMRLRETREVAGLLQRDVADKLNVSSGAYGLYERGARQPDPEFIAAFCRLFEVSADYILGLSDERTHKAPVSIAPTVIARDPLGDLLPEYRAQAEAYVEFLRQQQRAQNPDQQQEA